MRICQAAISDADLFLGPKIDKVVKFYRLIYDYMKKKVFSHLKSGVTTITFRHLILTSSKLTLIEPTFVAPTAVIEKKPCGQLPA